MPKIGEMTPEQREEVQRKRKELVEYYKSLDLKQDFMDENYWRELSRGIGVRLPLSYYPGDKKHVRKFLRKLGYSQKEFEDKTGGKLDELIDNNPRWPSYALCGICMELLEIENEL